MTCGGKRESPYLAAYSSVSCYLDFFLPAGVYKPKSLFQAGARPQWECFYPGRFAGVVHGNTHRVTDTKEYRQNDGALAHTKTADRFGHRSNSSRLHPQGEMAAP